MSASAQVDSGRGGVAWTGPSPAIALSGVRKSEGVELSAHDQIAGGVAIGLLTGFMTDVAAGVPSGDGVVDEDGSVFSRCPRSGGETSAPRRSDRFLAAPRRSSHVPLIALRASAPTVDARRRRRQKRACSPSGRHGEPSRPELLSISSARSAAANVQTLLDTFDARLGA